jgi:hypothetical protein
MVFKTRGLTSVFLIVLSLLGIGTAVAAPASACSTSARCYGTVINTTNGITGVTAILAPQCMSPLPETGVATQQIWLANSAESAWVEVGYIRTRNSYVGGPSGAIVDDGLYAFWGDLRPGQSYATHIITTNPSLSSKTAEISKGSSANSYTVKLGSFTGYSTGNTMVPYKGQFGAETSANGVHNFGVGTGVATKINSTWKAGAQGILTYKRNLTFTWTSGTTQYKAGAAC